MDIVALVLPIVVLIVLAVAVVVLRKEMRRWIWGDDGPDRRRGGRRG
jgi:hypothetical protein